MGKPGGSYVPSPVAEYIGCKERTQEVKINENKWNILEGDEEWIVRSCRNGMKNW